MTFEEIELLAKNGENLPKRPQPEDWLCWKAMTDLYRRYRARQIDRDSAKAEKQEIIQHYQAAVRNHSQYSAAYAQYQEFIRLGGKYLYQIREAVKARTDPLAVAELCLRMYGALCGESISSDTLIEQIKEAYCCGNKAQGTR